MLRYSRSIAGAFVAATMLVGMVAMAADKVPAAVAAAVADKGRPDADKERDANRKPAEVIAFAGIKKGEEKRKEREMKKIGKQVQLEKLKERRDRGRDEVEKVKGLKRSKCRPIARTTRGDNS